MSAVLEVREPGARYLSTLPPLLVRQFDLMATAPGGVGRLRELILSLAVHGKLVPQDRNDEPAIESLLRTRRQKDRLVGEGSLKMQKADALIANHETSVALPTGWHWARLADIVRVLNGRAYAKQELLETGPTPVLRVGNLFTSKHWYYSNLELEADKYCGPGDLLYAWSASFGPFIWGGPKSIFHYHIWKLDPVAPEEFDSRYLHIFLTEKTAELKAAGHGVSMVHLTKEKMERIAVACPPLAEQARIFGRVEELMRLCDALEAKGRLEAEQHARLLSALLGTLTDSASPDELATNWQRVAAHFDLLLDRPEAVDALEQTILQLAVRGLLVPRNPSDEQARAFLDGVREKGAQKMSSKSGRSAGFISSQTTRREPFKLPVGWTWSALPDLCAITGGSTPSKAVASNWNGSIPWVSPKDMKVSDIVDAQDHVSHAAVTGSLSLIEAGSLLMVVRGMILVHSFPVASTRVPVTINQDMKALTPFEPAILPWLMLVCAGMKTEILGLVERSTHGTCKLESPKIFGLAIPIPPLAEQGRIVARVARLRRLCTDLRERLSASQTAQSRLAEALVESAVA